MNNEHWDYQVSYAFRDSLDISYSERVKNKKPYFIWTQGPFICFNEGDTFYSDKGLRPIQVQSSMPMQWDDQKSIMILGEVVYAFFEDVSFAALDFPSIKVNQMTFLGVLMGNV